MSSWFLRNIPKKIFFYWGNKELPYLRMMSIISFHKLNPDWEVYYYYPAVRFEGKNTWTTGEQGYNFTGEDYTDHFKNNYPKINKICFDFRSIGLSNSMPEVFKSDFLRWYLLTEQGGIWADMDILFYKPITDFNLNKKENETKDTFICLNNGYHSIGFLMSGHNNLFFRKIFNYAKTSYSPRDYQSVGSHIFGKFNLNTINNIKTASISNIDMNTVYSIDSNNIEKIFKGNHSTLLHKDSIGIHWFGGSKLAVECLNKINADNYKNFNNTLSHCLERFYTGKEESIKNNKFKIITTFYNAGEWIGNCIRSVINQSYQDWEMCIVNDCSTDNSDKEVMSFLELPDNQGKIHYRKNSERVGNGLINMIGAIKDIAKDPDDIIIILDGDDWLSGNDVLEYLNDVYNNPETWFTYGSFEPLSGKYSGTCKQVEDPRTYRKSGKWTTSHLRSYKKFLWDKIKNESYKNVNGDYISSADDCAAMFAMIEMSGLKHSKFIDRVLYIYNDLNPINVMKTKEKEQLQNAEYIRIQNEYEPIDKIGISILITTFKRNVLLKYNLLSLSVQKLNNKYDYEIIILDEDEESKEIHDLLDSFKDCLNIVYINTAVTKNNKTDWRVPGYAFNIGVKKAKYDKIIIMCAEMYSLNKTIDYMIDSLLQNNKTMVIPDFAKDDDKTILNLLLNNQYVFKSNKLNNLRINLPFFMGFHKRDYIDIGGYDEDLTGIAYDDDDFVNRMLLNGCKYIKCSAEVIHLWHERVWSCAFNELPEEIKNKVNFNKNLYESRKNIIKRNVGKEWGVLKTMSESLIALCPKYPNDIKITMTITSCKRYNLLEQTLNSFFECCLDHDFIKEIILIDDNSSPEDVSRIIQLLQKINKPFIVVHKSSYHKGHANSLNYYFDLVKTDYIFQMEDDWLFTIKDNLISKALFVMDEYPEIKEVVYRIGTNMAKNQTALKTKNGIEYIKYNYENNQVRDNLDRPAWPGWNLNPSLQKWNDIKTLGKFNSEVSGVEFDFSRRYLKAGYKIAYFLKDSCKHLGDNNSSYTLNNTPK
jgi:glycosyltransferase involved in cell wall biosynthesis/mannosyltransferase OCH1-like enzyme